MSPCRKLTQLYTGKQCFYGDMYPVEQKQKETRIIVKIEPIKVSLQFSQSRKVGKRFHQSHLHLICLVEIQ